MRIVGIDEVGRGSIAGPLVAAAVIINQPLDGLKDSKQLSRLQRENYSTQILKLADAYGIGWVSSAYVDQFGLSKAIRLAMSKAICQIKLPYDEVIIDGSINYLKNIKGCRAVIKADGFMAPVMAASVIAKVARDKYMIKMAKRYPGYMFESHVGYGTREHLKIVAELGLTKIHRRSFAPCQLVNQALVG